jgi:hypothetical protein
MRSSHRNVARLTTRTNSKKILDFHHGVVIVVVVVLLWYLKGIAFPLTGCLGRQFIYSLVKRVLCLVFLQTDCLVFLTVGFEHKHLSYIGLGVAYLWIVLFHLWTIYCCTGRRPTSSKRCHCCKNKVNSELTVYKVVDSIRVETSSGLTKVCWGHAVEGGSLLVLVLFPNYSTVVDWAKPLVPGPVQYYR